MASNETGRTTGRSTVVGVFDRREQAERAIQDLEAAGFRDDQIGLAMRGGEASNVAGRSAEESAGSAGGGAATGAVLGGVLGAIAALVIPGIGPVVALGTLGTVLAGAAVGAGVGALAGGLVGMGVPEEEAQYYEGEFNEGRAIVTVQADGKYNQAQNILRAAGGHDIETRGPAAGATRGPAATRPATTPTAAAPPTPPARRGAAEGPRPRTEDDAETVRLREEQLVANKERVQTGQVEIGKRVVEEQRTIDVPVTKEEVTIERRPVNQPSTEPITGESRTIEVPVTEERVTVEKQTVVTEEIGVQKRAVQDTEQVAGTVRREEAVINTQGDARVAGGGAPGGQRRWEDELPRFRQHWQQTHGSHGGRWEEDEPAYRYGFDQHASGRYAGRSWSEVEPELRTDWTTRHPDRPWDRVSAAVRHAWEHLTGGAG